jgi:hypothetical protein
MEKYPLQSPTVPPQSQNPEYPFLEPCLRHEFLENRKYSNSVPDPVSHCHLRIKAPKLKHPVFWDAIFGHFLAQKHFPSISPQKWQKTAFFQKPLKMCVKQALTPVSFLPKMTHFKTTPISFKPKLTPHARKPNSF